MNNDSPEQFAHQRSLYRAYAIHKYIIQYVEILKEGTEGASSWPQSCSVDAEIWTSDAV